MKSISSGKMPAQATPNPGAGAAPLGFLAAVLAFCVLALMERVGAPERLISVSIPLLAIIGMIGVGLAARTMRISQFYAAGRKITANQGAMALAAAALAAAAPFGHPGGWPPASAEMATAIIFALLLSILLVGPLLRKSGAFSLADLLAARFPGAGFRIAIVLIAACASGLMAWAGLESAASVLARGLDLSRPAALAAACAALVAICAPGGLGGVLWCAVAALGMALIAFAAPLAEHLWSGGTLPLPVLGDRLAMEAGLARLAAAPGDAIAAPWDGRWAFAAILGAGLALSPAFAGVFVGLPNAAAARRAGLGALLWGAPVFAGALALALISQAGLDAVTLGAKPGQLPPSVYAASARGDLAICSAHPATPAAAQAACGATGGFTGVLQARQIEARPPWALWLGAGVPRALAASEAAAMTAALAALGLALAAGGLLGLAAALGNDLFHRLGDSSALTSRRLAATRLILATSAIAAGGFAGGGAQDPKTLILLSAVLSAAALLPLLALAFWPPATGRDALLALAAGLAAAVWESSLLQFSQPAGLFAAVPHVAAAILGTGLLASLMHRRPRPWSAFTRELLFAQGDALHPDKGA